MHIVHSFIQIIFDSHLPQWHVIFIICNRPSDCLLNPGNYLLRTCGSDTLYFLSVPFRTRLDYLNMSTSPWGSPVWFLSSILRHDFYLQYSGGLLSAIIPPDFCLPYSALAFIIWTPLWCLSAILRPGFYHLNSALVFICQTPPWFLSA